jgi:hypothetical protein
MELLQARIYINMRAVTAYLRALRLDNLIRGQKAKVLISSFIQDSIDARNLHRSGSDFLVRHGSCPSLGPPLSGLPDALLTGHDERLPL